MESERKRTMKNFVRDRKDFEMRTEFRTYVKIKRSLRPTRNTLVFSWLIFRRL